MGILTPEAYQVMINVFEEGEFYEIPDDLVGKSPETTNEERIVFARSTIIEFFNNGWIEVWLAEWPRKLIRQVSSEDLQKVLDTEGTWQRVSEAHRTYVFAILSATGKQARANGNFS